MVTKQQKVHASFGEWSCEKDSEGQVGAYVGRFSQDDRDHALGTARWLSNSAITPKYAPPLLGDDNRWVIRLRAGSMDNLAKFERQKSFAELLPERAEEIRNEQPAFAKRLQARSGGTGRRMTGFRPLGKARVENMIRHMRKERAAEGPGREIWVLVTDVPEIALQAATYLQRAGYVGAGAFSHLRQDAHYAMQNDETVEFRIGITNDERKFEKEFIDSSDAKPLGRQEIAEIVRQSHPSGRGGRTAG